MQPEDYTRRIRDFYAPLLAEHADSTAAVGYAEPAGQQGRYAILCEVGDLTNASVLDIGCGMGHLLDFLKTRGFAGDYLGIDLQPEMVERARRRHPDAQFEVTEYLVEAKRLEGRDFMLASGVLQHGDRDTMERMIAAMYAGCRVAAAFNAFSTWYDKHPDPRFYVADPVATLEYCRGLTQRVLFRHEYVAHDFTVYLYRP